MVIIIIFFVIIIAIIIIIIIIIIIAVVIVIESIFCLGIENLFDPMDLNDNLFIDLKNLRKNFNREASFKYR